MHIVIFTHPSFRNSQSMPRYAEMLAGGLKSRQHTVEMWTAKKFFYSLPFPFKKWLGYLDEFIIFPLRIKQKLRKLPADTLFVFTDHGLGPWVKLVADRPNIIHCHDFLAQRSEREELPENKLKFSGRVYQRWIRNGYRKGRNFISISNNTRNDLHRFLSTSPDISEVIYNGLNQNFKPGDFEVARLKLQEKWELSLLNGFILHVGGNQFYKNRAGVIKIYNAWRKIAKVPLPLLMIGPGPNKELINAREMTKYNTDIYFLTGVSDDLLRISYRAASVLLFPSLEEGFGWPIAEAMASGCPVITTKKAPMTEVGNESGFYISRMPEDVAVQDNWAKESAVVLDQILNLSDIEKKKVVASGLENSKRFNTQKSIKEIESVYNKVLKLS